MIDEFTRFCIMHACAKAERGSEKYCPLADEIREKNQGMIPTEACEQAWERYKQEERRKA